MFFNQMKTIAERGISDIFTLSCGSHTTSATLDAMRQKHDAVRDELNDILDDAETKRGRAWAVWALTGIPNIFISIPWISLPLSLITMAAVCVTGYHQLKVMAARKCIRQLDKEVDPLIDDAQRQHRAILVKQRQQEIDAAQRQRRMDQQAATKQPTTSVADGFNNAVSDIDLDQDITVRRIKLKPKDPAAAVA